MKTDNATGGNEVKGFNPIRSLGKFLLRSLTGRMSGMPRYLHRTVTYPDGARFTVFRTIMIKPGTPSCGGALFMVRFTPEKMSLAANRIFSLVPIPLFTGLPGFRAKCWMENRATGACSGLYQWDSAAEATAYSRSFAVRFMTRRSKPGSVTWNIIPEESLDEYLVGKVSG